MAIRKNKETNAVLTRLNSELQQQFKVSPLLSSQSTNLTATGSHRVHVKTFFSCFVVVFLNRVPHVEALRATGCPC